LNTDQLHNLFQIRASHDAPVILIYSKTLTERLAYTCRFVFEHVLNCRYEITTELSVFQQFASTKINYSDVFVENAFQILPHTLLFETGVDPLYTLSGEIKNGRMYFHLNTSNDNLGHDLFASVFYFISRYQEWQTFPADEHGRFELVASIQHKLGCHLDPLVNIWIEELKEKLKLLDRSMAFPIKKFRYISTVDVDNLYAYRSKGALRTLGAIAKDLVTGKFSNLQRRLSVLSGRISDPFDVYAQLNELAKSTGVPLIYFFLQRSNTKYDRTVNPNSDVFKKVFNELMKSKVPFGLHPSYHTSVNKDLMKNEFDRMRERSSAAATLSRQHFLRFQISSTPQQLIENGVQIDFTMGFASGAGYRAATFTPFYYFDLNSEQATDLLMVPFVAMDGSYFVYSQTSAQQAESELFALAETARKLNGLFVTVFHERTFDPVLYPSFGELYIKLQKNLG